MFSFMCKIENHCWRIHKIELRLPCLVRCDSWYLLCMNLFSSSGFIFENKQFCVPLYLKEPWVLSLWNEVGAVTENSHDSAVKCCM